MASVSQHLPLPTPSLISSLSGPTLPDLQTSRAAEPSSSRLPPLSSLEPRHASSGKRRPYLPFPSSLPSNLSPPWQGTSTSSQLSTTSLRQGERSVEPTNSSFYSEWASSREPYGASSARQSSPKMQSSSQDQHQLYMLPNMSTSASTSYAPAPHTYGGLGSLQDMLSYGNPYSNASTFGNNGMSSSHMPSFAAESQWGRSDGEPSAQVGPAEYAQAVDIWRHVRAALPHVRSVDALGPPATGQPYRSLFDIAETAVCVLTGVAPKKPPTNTRPPPNTMPEPKRARVSNGGDKDKPATYCRGCGATETPEWRRGPLGPRTLCNACGLVHMKMMRKKKKAEEKAAAEAAAKGGA